jgi:hypothetical protein
MKASQTMAITIALIGGLGMGAPLRADEECDNVVKALEEAIGIANRSFEETMNEVQRTMSRGADDKTKATVKNTFCSVSGELLGTSLAFRAITQQCGPARRRALASLDKSIREMQAAIDGTCK